ncbi:phosphopantetheine-binding protein [Kitasatospora sp. NBC_00240]|uniref:phosphopantetheine-binding protein n=1 Tax=Kitasatospora sp. NBC_00240 TaxID=2903567 RepID=UPI00224C90D3|nr:phosphopantetheine-binding protein [Kitasatospora sp. NBC_00240]MCX5207887.1 phosphopantetheine-binding protein [Kitasatospora sp. NBC_00240]
MSVDTTSAALGGAPDGARPEAGPGAETEAVVAVFRRVLENPDAGADTDFFQLGGDSLIATRVLSAIARGHGVELSFEDFLLAPTPRGLAGKIAAAR